MHVDKWVHVLLFAVLFVLLVKGFRQCGAVGITARYPGVAALLVVLLYAILTETVQEAFTTDRHGDPADVAADLGGALLGAAYLRWGPVLLGQHRKRWERYF